MNVGQTSLAESEGFEPSGPLQALQFSRLLRSTTLPTLRDRVYRGKPKKARKFNLIYWVFLRSENFIIMKKGINKELS